TVKTPPQGSSARGFRIATYHRRFADMIEPTRQEILARLARLSELAPDLRFGQMIANFALMAAGPWDQTLWDLEDERLLEAIRQLEADLSKRIEEASLPGNCPGQPVT